MSESPLEHSLIAKKRGIALADLIHPLRQSKIEKEVGATSFCNAISNKLIDTRNAPSKIEASPKEKNLVAS